MKCKYKGPEDECAGLCDKEGEDPCFWIKVSGGARGFKHSFNKHLLGVYCILGTVLGTGNSRGLNRPNIFCPYSVYILLRKTGR